MLNPPSRKEFENEGMYHQALGNWLKARHSIQAACPHTVEYIDNSGFDSPEYYEVFTSCVNCHMDFYYVFPEWICVRNKKSFSNRTEFEELWDKVRPMVPSEKKNGRTISDHEGILKHMTKEWERKQDGYVFTVGEPGE